MQTILSMLKTNVEVQDFSDRRPVVLEGTFCSFFRRDTRGTHVKSTYRALEGQSEHSRGRDLQGLQFLYVLIKAQAVSGS